MTEQEDMYSTATPEDPKSLHSNTVRSIRNLALDHMLEHRSAFEGSLGSKSNTRTTTDRITANTEIDTVMEEELAGVVSAQRRDEMVKSDREGRDHGKFSGSRGVEEHERLERYCRKETIWFLTPRGVWARVSVDSIEAKMPALEKSLVPDQVQKYEVQNRRDVEWL